MNLANIPPFQKGGLVHVVVETPKGSRNKLAYDPGLKHFVLKKTLPEGMVFPFDFGFIPQTVGQDGDPLDALLLMPESLPPGTVVTCRIIAVIEARQFGKNDDKGVRNDRFLAVSDAACEFSDLRDAGDLPEGMLPQLERFFVNYNQLEGRRFKLKGVQGAKPAMKTLRHAYRAAREAK